MRVSRAAVLSFCLACPIAGGLRAGAAAAAEAGAEADRRDSSLAVARSAVENGIYIFALEKLQKLVGDESYERRAEAALLLAKCHLHLGRPERAERLLAKFKGEFGERGRLSEEAAYLEARADLELAKTSAPESAARRGYLSRAQRLFRRLLSESANSRILSGARFYLAETLFEKRDFRAALLAFQEARRAGVPPAETARSALYLGRCRLALGDLREAAEAFKFFVEKFPKHEGYAEALYGLGEAHYYLGGWSEAAEAYKRAASAAAGDKELSLQARRAAAWALAKSGDKLSGGGRGPEAAGAWLEAMRLFEAVGEALPAGPERRSSRFQVGELLFKLGKYAEAAERLWRFADPSRGGNLCAPALYLIGRSRAELGQLEESRTALSRALALAEGELLGEVRVSLAETSARMGRASEAQDVLRPLAGAEQDPPVRARARFQMARIARLAASRALEGEDPAAERAAHWYARAWELFSSLHRDKPALVHLDADEALYWTARSADDRFRLEGKRPPAGGGGPRPVWLGRALESYKELIESGSSREWTRRALFDSASLRVFAGDIEGAARAYGDLLKDRSIPAEMELAARLGLADADLRLSRPGPAEEALGPVLKEKRLSAGLPEALYKRAVAARAQGRLEEALSAFRSFVAGHAGSEFEPEARAGLGEVLAALGRHAEAAEVYEGAARSFPDSPVRDGALLAAAEARLAAGERKEAERLHRLLFETGREAPLKAKAGLGLARLRSASGARGEALELIDKVTAIAPPGSVTASLAQELKGGILVEEGRLEEAEAAFARASGSMDAGVAARARLARAGVLFELGRTAEAAGARELLEGAARLFTEVVYAAPGAGLKERAIYSGVDVLVELASIREASNDHKGALARLREAEGLLGLSSDKPRAEARLKEVKGRMRGAGRR